ncbi:MAG: hypothetical protein PHP88_05560 [bacterium]|nr:hypothetical protein [bacterium]
MKNPCRLTALLLILPLLELAAFPRYVRAAEDAEDAIGKELLSVNREMDTLSSELDRIAEIATVPKATSLRIEIRRAGEISPPASAKLLLSGKTGAEREFSKEERDAFLSGSGAIVWNIPVLPGPYEARLVLSHPYAKQSPSFEFRPSPKAGETFLLRLTLGFAKEKTGAVLVASPEN